MAKTEYKFSKEQVDLISLGKIEHVFNPLTDYIRLNVFDAEDDTILLYTFASNRPLLKKSDGSYYFDHYHMVKGQYWTGKRADFDADPRQEKLTLVANNQLKS